MIFRLFSIPVSIFLLMSCASGYRTMNPHEVNFTNAVAREGLEFSYRYNVLYDSGNEDYSEKEMKSRIKVLSVKIKNNTGRKQVVGTDILFMMNNKPVTLVSAARVEEVTEQGTLGYLFYLLLSPMQLTITRENRMDTYPVGLVIGPGLAFGNMLYASSSNTRLRENLENENIIGKTIADGETAHGLLYIMTDSLDPVSVRLR